MNMRNMLLAGLLFVAPCFASQNAPAPAAGTPAVVPGAAANQPAGAPANQPEVQQQDAGKKDETKPADSPSKIAAAWALVTAPFIAVGETGLKGIDFVADWTVNPLLNGITNNQYLNKLQPHVKTTGRFVVSAALITATYLAYQAWLDAQDDASDDEEIFFEDAKYSRR